MSKSTLTFTQQPAPQERVVNLWALLWGAVWALLIVVLIARIFWLQQVSVVGMSMEPNYSTNQLLAVDQLFSDYRRGQVVAVYDNIETARGANYFTRFQPDVRFLLKRIIGLPGEAIEIRGAEVIIYNDEYPGGAILEEEYVDEQVKATLALRNRTLERTEIPSGEYFVMGDNRTNSTDSREKGTFPDFAILGFERFRFYPLSTAHWFDLPEYRFTPLN